MNMQIVLSYDWVVGPLEKEIKNGDREEMPSPVEVTEKIIEVMETMYFPCEGTCTWYKERIKLKEKLKGAIMFYTIMHLHEGGWI